MGKTFERDPYAAWLRLNIYRPRSFQGSAAKIPTPIENMVTLSTWRWSSLRCKIDFNFAGRCDSKRYSVRPYETKIWKKKLQEQDSTSI